LLIDRHHKKNDTVQALLRRFPPSSVTEHSVFQTLLPPTMLRQRPPKSKNSPSRATNTPGTSSPRRSSRLSTGVATVTTATPADDPRVLLLGSAKAGASTSLSESHSASLNVDPPPAVEEEMLDLQNMSRKSQWIILAVASGCCAAFNGVFAKLT
jgi:hypothetical protein